MNGVIREDRIRNEYVRGSIRVASIIDKMRENRLRWLVWSCYEERKFRSCIYGYGNEGEGKRERPKKKWLDTIGCNIRIVGVCVRLCRKSCHLEIL